MKLIDLTGRIFGKLKVIERATNTSKGKSRWVCECDCPNKTRKIVEAYNLKSGHTTSCGCVQRERAKETRQTHGKSEHPLYHIWSCMRARCHNANDVNYHHYGGRGITVCDEWRNDFYSFYKWAIENGYDETAKYRECTLDRIDNNKGYSPNNCRWVNTVTQQNNKRNNYLLTYNEKTQTVSQWAREVEMPYSTLYSRLYKSKWGVARALTTPIKK